jgi:hypothetical protein
MTKSQQAQMDIGDQSASTCNDPAFQEAVGRPMFDIVRACQPSNSPDFNVLDLGFFNSIQSLKHQYAPSTRMEELWWLLWKMLFGNYTTQN